MNIAADPGHSAMRARRDRDSCGHIRHGLLSHPTTCDVAIPLKIASSWPAGDFLMWELSKFIGVHMRGSRASEERTMFFVPRYTTLLSVARHLDRYPPFGIEDAYHPLQAEPLVICAVIFQSGEVRATLRWADTSITYMILASFLLRSID